MRRKLAVEARTARARSIHAERLGSMSRDKVPITAADILNDRLLPLFEKHEGPLLRVLTYRGTECCEREDSQDYQLFSGLNDIEHTSSKANHPQTNRIWERLNRTIQEEFYRVAFRKNLYRTLGELQVDLNVWLV